MPDDLSMPRAIDGASPAGRRRLLAHGFEPIPIRGKFPTFDDWQIGDVTAERLAAVEAAKPDHTNTGLRTGRLVVADIDARDASHVDALIETLEAELGPTLFRRIGSKGAALCYYNLEPIRKITVSAKPPGADKPVRIIEFLGSGQQVAAYGIHPDTGRPYEWSNDIIDRDPLGTPLEKLPRVDPAKIRAAASAADGKLASLGYTDINISESGAERDDESSSAGPPATPEIIDSMLRHVDPDCDRMTWLKVCAALKCANVMDEVFDGLDLFQRWSAGEFHEDEPDNYIDADDCAKTWNSLTTEKSGGAGFGSLVFLARRGGYAGLACTLIGALPDDHGADDIPDTAPATDTVERDRPMAVAELLIGHFPRPQHLWKDLLLEGHVNLLHADGGTGKTMLAQHAGVAIAAGVKLFGRPTLQRPALLVLCEDDYGETRFRLQKIAESLGVDLNAIPIFVWCRVGKDSTLAIIRDDGQWSKGPFFDPLNEELAKAGPAFCVLDTISDIAALDESQRLPVNAFLKTVLGGICKDRDATFLVNAHPSKASMADGTMYSGTTAYNNAVRSRLTLERPEKGRPDLILRTGKNNYGASTELKLYQAGPLLVDTSGYDEVKRDGYEREAVLSVVADLTEAGIYVVRGNGSGQKPADVAKAVKEKFDMTLTAGRVLELLNSLERAGMLRYDQSDKNKGTKAGFRIAGPKGP